MIYADNAATTALDADAFEAMKPFLLAEYGNASQPYSFSRPAKKALRNARETIAACIGAQPDEIYFTSGGTESDNWAIKGIMHDHDGQAMITSQIEHHAVLNACAAVEQLGFPVRYLPVDTQGIVAETALKHAITDNIKIKLVSIMLANNEIGTIEPISKLSAIAHEHGAFFHTDAVQAVGHIQLDVKQFDIDMLSASAHKFNGPKGIGFLYIKKGTAIQPFLHGGSQEFSMRAGTENIASIVAMAVALRKNCEYLHESTAKLHRMEESFLQILERNTIDFLYNGAKTRIPGNINLSIKGTDGEMLLHRMDLKGICISTGSACDSVNTQISHVIQAIQVPDEYARGTIRISFGTQNQESDAQAVASALIEILKK